MPRPNSDFPEFKSFFKMAIVMWLVAALLSVAMLGASVWVVVWVLRYMGVIPA